MRLSNSTKKEMKGPNRTSKRILPKKMARKSRKAMTITRIKWRTRMRINKAKRSRQIAMGKEEITTTNMGKVNRRNNRRMARKTIRIMKALKLMKIR